MPRMTARERREAYQREHDFQTRTGKPFFPYAIFHDTVTSLVTVGLIMGLAILWHEGFGPVNDDGQAGRAGGFLGPAYENQADPGTESYDPRPEWYFFFLFQLLRIFKNPHMLLFATIIIPTLLMVLLLAWPFIDRRPERRVSRRPAAMVLGIAIPIVLLFLTWQGSKAPVDRGRVARTRAPRRSRTRCRAARATRSPTRAPAVRWARTSTTRSPTIATALEFITNGKGGMPSFKQQGLTDDQLKCMAGYVATWAGAPARRRARTPPLPATRIRHPVPRPAPTTPAPRRLIRH